MFSSSNIKLQPHELPNTFLDGLNQFYASSLSRKIPEFIEILIPNWECLTLLSASFPVWNILLLFFQYFHSGKDEHSVELQWKDGKLAWILLHFNNLFHCIVKLKICHCPLHLIGDLCHLKGYICHLKGDHFSLSIKVDGSLNWLRYKTEQYFPWQYE